MKISQAQASLLDKWSKAPGSLSISSIKDYNVRMNTARLLENQNKGNLSENLLTEDFTQGVGAPLGLDQGIPHGGDAKGVFAPISMALVRRVFPQLFANVLVGVQPLNGPVGLAFALRYIYKTNDPTELVEAAWKAVPRFSGFSGSTQNTDGAYDAGTGVDTQTGEGWGITKQGDRKMPELGLMLSRQSIVAKTRKLAASFSLESAADIKAMQGIEMMSEMINVLQAEMTDEEQRLVANLCAHNRLDDEHYLIKDGSLEYNPSFSNVNRPDKTMLRENYRYVVGVSKRFDPELLPDYEGHRLSKTIANLKPFERTKAYRYTSEANGVQYAVWYLRLRNSDFRETNFSDVVKCEMVIINEEEQMDTDLINIISANLINEAYPVCYGNDTRWANHLYPVFLTESFCKSKYYNSDIILNLF